MTTKAERADVQARGRVMNEKTGSGSCRSFRWALPSTRNRVATRLCSPEPSVYRPSPVGSNIGRAIFPSLSLETASGYTVAETWSARLWAMLALGHARTTQLTGQQTKENVRALTFSESCGFPFSFHFTEPLRSVPTSFLGVLFLFSAFLFRFNDCL